MSEPILPPQAAPDLPIQAPGKDFGTILREARLAAAMEVPTLAARLRLHPKQVEALERCDLDSLPDPIYVRGFLRGCARELKIDPQPMLVDLDRRAGVDLGTLPAPLGPSLPRFRFGDSAKPIIALLLFVLVLAGIVGTLIPRRPPPAPVQLALPQAQEPTSGPSASAPADTVVPAPPPPQATSTEVAPASLAQPGNAAPHGVELPEQRGASHAIVPTNPHAPPPSLAVSVSAATSPGKGDVAEHAAGEPVRATDAAELVLHIRAEAWVEVMQSDGTTLLSQVCAPGTTQTIKGKEPLRVVIGNPAGVDAQFRGVSVDLSRYTSPSGVARLTLE